MLEIMHGLEVLELERFLRRQDLTRLRAQVHVDEIRVEWLEKLVRETENSIRIVRESREPVENLVHGCPGADVLIAIDPDTLRRLRDVYGIREADAVGGLS